MLLFSREGNAWYIEDMYSTCAYRKSAGFTLVELAVTILIISILVATSVFAWGAWRQQTAINTLKSDLSQASAQLKSDLNWKNTYPATKEAANDGKGLPQSKGTSLEYSRIAANQYCLTATSDVQGVSAFHVTSSNSIPQEGACVGHYDPSSP